MSYKEAFSKPLLLLSWLIVVAFPLVLSTLLARRSGILWCSDSASVLGTLCVPRLDGGWSGFLHDPASLPAALENL